MHAAAPPTSFPLIRDVGLSGMLVTFSDQLSEAANRAALAFRGAVEATDLPGLEECSTSLTSTFVRFDPLALPHATLRETLSALLAQQDWFAAALPQRRRLWRVPTVYDPALAPQLEECAAAAGMSLDQAVAEISSSQVRILTIGHSPSMPYMGELPEVWDLPRLAQLTPQVPVGALVLAIRQLIVFSVSTPTGWSHVGQTAFRAFRPDSDTPFALRPGDEMIFPPVSRETLENIRANDTTGDGGATIEALS